MAVEFKVFDLGSSVPVGHFDGKGIQATVTAIRLTSSGVEYELVYWSGSERKCITVWAFEVTPSVKSKQTKIGFQQC